MTSNKTFLVIIVLIACVGQFASDIYSPAIPAISHALKTPVNLVQTSMTIYMLGMALSLLVYGPLSEGYGRKKPLYVGIIILIIGSAICLFAPNIYILILGRFIQGIGAGAGAGLWRAIFRDVFTGVELAKQGSYMTILVTFIIPAAPLVGSNLQHFISWRAIFAFMLFYGFAAFVVAQRFLIETNPQHHKKKLRLAYIMDKYKTLLADKVFIKVSLTHLWSVFLSANGKLRK